MRYPDKYKGAFIPREDRERGKLTPGGVGGKHLGALLGFRAAEFRAPNPYEVRAARLKELGYGSDRAAPGRYLAGDRWKQLRAEAGDSTECFSCTRVLGWNVARVHLHHIDYANIGTNREIDDIQPLCASCHRGIHVLANEGAASLRTATDDYRDMLVEFIRICEERVAAEPSALNHVEAKNAFATYVLPDRIRTATHLLHIRESSERVEAAGDS